MVGSLKISVLSDFSKNRKEKEKAIDLLNEHEIMVPLLVLLYLRNGFPKTSAGEGCLIATICPYKYCL